MKNMNRTNKKFFGMLGGATLGILIFTSVTITKLIPTVPGIVLAIIGGVVGGLIGNYIGKHATILTCLPVLTLILSVTTLKSLISL